ncbi:PREDICTED: RNA polymerase sigma factor sigF, chloroplastic isoform X1 [Nelumbo nucifera]|nr:PREDICTED: RNA polymerase sigma factor sigF, chloroplastic isoform X1 [Nelumbo nucifera]
MEVGRNLVSSASLFPPRTQLKNSSSSGMPVTLLHEQANPIVVSMPTTSITRHFPASVLLQEQRDDIRPFLQIIREDKTSQAMLDRRKLEDKVHLYEEKKSCQPDRYWEGFERQLLYWPGLWYLLPSLYKGEKPLLSMVTQSTAAGTVKNVDVRPCDALELAKKAVLASKQAASLAKDYELFGADSHESFLPDLEPRNLANKIPLREEVAVRSKRLLERQSKRRWIPRPKVVVSEASTSRKSDIHKKIHEGFDTNDPLRLFLWGPETKQLLTPKEESELFVHVQELIRLEEVKQRLQSQFDREPTLVEWAEAVGMTCQSLQSILHSGNSSREKIIYANFRLVVHVAKHYQGQGLNLQDLLQEGSMGLMKSLEKFKPQAGCRFATYAYWWIRQAIRKAIFQNSRTIRLPENVYSLLSQVKKAKKLFIQEGHHPTNEELAKRVGITVEKLERLFMSTRMPLSIQQPVWADQDTTFQEITADTEVEKPDLCVAKQLMRRHVRNLISILPPKERRIIRMRYGIENNEPKSLQEIGSIFGLSKERVRQLESRALHKLKQCLSSQGLGAYADLLV